MELIEKMRNSRMKADSVYFNGKIVTMDEEDTISRAVAVKFGRFIKVGKEEEVKSLIGDDTEVVDLKGKTVIPGLIDSHCHMLAVGAQRRLNVDLSEEAGVHSINDLVNKLRKRAENTPKGEWVLGYQEDDSKLEEKRHPTRWELDEASTEHPIMISTVGGHFSMANSKTFELAGVTKESEDPVGGKFDRDQKGELTGGLHEKAIDMILPKEVTIPSRKQSLQGGREILEECASVGLTCVYDTVEKPQIRAALDLKNAGKLPIRVRMDVGIDLFPELEKLGIYRGLGDDWIRVCGLKFFFDGAISARTAAVTEEYLNKPGFYGVMATTREIATKTIMDAYKQGYRISAHANGDRAIAMYLDIMEEAQRKYPREDPRNRDIHCTVITPELVERIKDLDILPTIFGPYVYYHGDKLIPAFGEKRLERMFAARYFLDADVKIAAHSDHPCAPYPPLMAIHGLVNRRTKTGKPIGQSQKISVKEALKLYTTHSAYQQLDEDKLGSIEEGKLADMVVLGEDILTVDSEKIKDISIERTIIEGKTVYQS
ncbi:amidohydrolase family protein [Candidatus Bathyarchaeota archaeon]|nr:amidohydrolase family protein [Candidatus Bathyarchaeota archaeon]